MSILAHTCSRSLRASRPLLASAGSFRVDSSRCHAVLKPSKSDQRSFLHTARFTLPGSFLKSRASPTRQTPQSSILSTAWAAAYTSSASQSKYAAVKDESHPSLFYHLFDDDKLLRPVFSLSFLEERPRTPRSHTVLGWLSALSPADAERGESGLNDFVQNEEFLPLLHKTLKEGLLEDEIWTNGAIQAQSGWMHIFDQRNPPPLGRIPDPDDILASIRVEGGRMLIDTYAPMPSYRLCTGDGVCQLTDTLMDRLKVALKRVAEDERENN